MRSPRFSTRLSNFLPRARAVVALIAALGLSACGGSSQSVPSQAPVDGDYEASSANGPDGERAGGDAHRSPPATMASTPEQLALELEALERDLTRIEKSDDSDLVAADPKVAGHPSGVHGTQKASGTRCESACRTIKRMKAATERICSLTGDDDDRCTDARDRSKRAAGRVRTMCPACAASVPAEAGPAEH